ncbi:MAG: NAD-dependent epimerase/dehydratase family protein [Acidimicrobiales bacterium]
MRVCVTGGAGFIGSAACRALLARPEVSSVVVLDDLSTGSRSNLDGLGAAVVEASVADRDAVAAACSGVDAIVHLAAQVSVPASIADPVTTIDVNVNGTLNVLEAARTVGAYTVVASSAAVYGPSPHLPTNEDAAPAPAHPYGASKLATEALALAHARSYGCGVLALRFFNVFGPGQAPGHGYAAVVPAFVDAALAGRPLPVFGDGEQTRDFTDVELVASLLADGVSRRVSHDGPVNVASGDRHSLLELIAVLEAVLGRPLERKHLPPRPGDARHSQANISRLRHLFPDVRPRPLDEAVRATVEWFMSRQ